MTRAFDGVMRGRARTRGGGAGSRSSRIPTPPPPQPTALRARLHPHPVPSPTLAMRHLVGSALILFAFAASAASAHPLGNFTTNRQARITIESGRLAARYVVDMAELPAYRTLAEMDANGDGSADDGEHAAWAARLGADVARNLHVTIDGHETPLRAVSHEAVTQTGTGGLPTLRVEIGLESPLGALRGTLVVRDDGFAGLPGWQEIVVEGGSGVALGESTARASDRTNGLRSYPADALAAPPQMREARVAFAPGVAAMAADGTTARRGGAERFGDRLTALVADRTPLTAGVVLSALLAAAVLGALHALTPGHGKTIVGAYLVGARGTWRHAVFLGLVVTATHTAGVYALGAATLVASAWILPERLMPWLSAASGLLVLTVGASLLGERFAVAVHGHSHGHGGHSHAHDHDGHAHSHAPGDMAPTLRNLVALGVSGGMLPCPSALVVMLGAITLGRTAFGLALILAFSTGLAAVLTAIGLVLVYARRVFERLPIDGRFARFAPVASAAIISLAGLALVVEALSRIGA
jgi:nickel/cobalt exporter